MKFKIKYKIDLIFLYLIVILLEIYYKSIKKLNLKKLQMIDIILKDGK